MHHFFTSTGRQRLAALALLAATAVALSACGGGSEEGPNNGPPDGGSGGPVPAPSINTLAGDWVQKGCVNAGAESFKKFLRANITGQTTIDYHEGVLSFAGNGCAGASQRVGPSKLGTVAFARSEANTNLAAHWGEFLTVTGTRFGAIWTLQSNTLLCLLGDERPTIQPTLSAVAASLATVPADNCFVR